MSSDLDNALPLFVQPTHKLFVVLQKNHVRPNKIKIRLNKSYLVIFFYCKTLILGTDIRMSMYVSMYTASYICYMPTSTISSFQVILHILSEWKTRQSVKKDIASFCLHLVVMYVSMFNNHSVCNRHC